MNKYRALVGFAGSVLSMYSGEEREIEDDVADEFVKIGYIVKVSDLTSEPNEEDKNETSEPNKEDENETKKTKTKKK